MNPDRGQVTRQAGPSGLQRARGQARPRTLEALPDGEPSSGLRVGTRSLRKARCISGPYTAPRGVQQPRRPPGTSFSVQAPSFAFPANKVSHGWTSQMPGFSVCPFSICSNLSQTTCCHTQRASFCFSSIRVFLAFCPECYCFCALTGSGPGRALRVASEGACLGLSSP